MKRENVDLIWIRLILLYSQFCKKHYEISPDKWVRLRQTLVRCHNNLVPLCVHFIHDIGVTYIERVHGAYNYPCYHAVNA